MDVATATSATRPLPKLMNADPVRHAPMRRLAMLGLVFVAAILSCGKDVTGPLGAAARYASGIAWDAIFPPAFQQAGSAGGSLVPFTSVHVVLHHSDGTVALDTTIVFPADSTSYTADLTVKLLDGAPSTGEPMTLNLGYLNAAGETVFSGGPVSVTAAPPPPGGGSNPPVQVPVQYTGPGASAVGVQISPNAGGALAGGSFTFTAIAVDATGATVPNTPIVWSSLDPAIATVASAASGTVIAGSTRGTARIEAQLLTGPSAQATLSVTLPASQLLSQGGSGQSGVVGTTLAQALTVKVAASDGVGVAGVPVTFSVASGGGSVSSGSATSDANGLASTSWKLGTTVGAQSVTASAGALTGSPITFSATATAATATKLVVTSSPGNAVAGAALSPLVVSAEDVNGNVATTYTGSVSIGFGSSPSGAALAGTTTVNAVAGVATFSGLTINKSGTGYTIAASSGTLTGATTGSFDIAAGPPSKLVFTSQPATALINASIGAISVAAQDAEGNPTPLFTGTVSLSLAGGPANATLSGTTSATAAAGVATFSGLTVSQAGTFTLGASAAGLTGATSSSFAITGGGGATTLTMASGGAQTGAAGATLALPIVLTVSDAGGNPVSGTTVNFAVVTGGGSVAPTSSVSNASGRVQTVWTLGPGIGAQSISATSGTLNGSPTIITATATATTTNKVWTGATNNQWATASNWSPAGVPVATDSVSVPLVTNLPQLSASTTVADLYLATGATLTLTSGAVTLTVNGTLDATGGILGSGSVSLGGAGRTLKGVIAGAVTIGGTYSLNGTTTVAGNTAINSGGSLVMNGNTYTITAGNFSTAGTGTLTQTNAADALTVAGNVTFAGGSETGLLTNGLLSLTGNFVQSTTATSFVAGGTHSVVLFGAAAQSINFANPGTSTFNGLTSANTVGVTLLSNVVTNGNLSTAGPVTGAFGLTIGGQLLDPTGGVSGGSISFSGAVNPVSASTATINEPITFNSAATLLANLTVNGGINVNSAAGALTIGAHTLTSNGAFSTVNSGTIVMNVAGAALIVNGNANFGGGASTLANGTLTITGNFSQTITTNAFAAGNLFHTIFTGATPTISFANPVTSFFGQLALETTGAMTFSTDVLTGSSVWLMTGTTPSVTNAGHTVTIGGGLYDTTGGRWQVANTLMTNGGALPRSLNTNLAINASTTLTDSLKLLGATNALAIISGNFNLGGHYVKVPGAFSTSGTGTFSMMSAHDSLIVKGNASFAGGGTAGQLTNGYFEFDGANFTQAVNPQTFSADAPHITWFWGLTAQTIAFANPGAASSHFGNLYLQDTATVLASGIYLNGELETGGQASFHVSAASDELVTSNGANLRNIVFDNVRWKTAGTNGNALFPSLDNVIFKNISNTTAAQFDYEYSTKTNLTLAGFTFNTVPTGAGSYITIVGPDTLTMTGVSPALSGGWLNLSGGGAVLGWPNTVMWGGTISTDWNVAGNWSSGVVPGIATDVTVPSGTPFTATTTTASNTHNLTVNSGATVLVNGGTLTVNGNLTVQPAAAVSISGNYAFSVYGNATTDTAGTTGVTTCNSGQGTNLQAGTHTVTGKFCNLSIFGNYTASGPIVTTGPAGAGFLQPSGSTGNLTLNGHRVDANQFWSQSGGTITMTNAADSLMLHGGATGAAYFMGGAEAGLMTAGTIVVRSLTFDITGQGIDASGTHTTVIDSAGLQQISWSSPVAGHGLNNLIVKSGSTVNVGTSTVTINGDLTMQPTALMTNNENSQIVLGGNVTTDTAGTTGIACSNGYGVNLTGTSKTVTGKFCLMNIFGTYTASGPIVVSAAAALEGLLSVSGAGANLTLNGHNVFTQSFNTASGGTLTMNNALDTLSAHGGVGYGITFSGGATTGLLTAGTIIDKTSTFTATGLAYDASGTHTLVLDTMSTAFQTLTFNSSVPGHGSNNVTMKGTASKGFSGDQWINGTLLFDATMVGPGNVQGSYNIHVNTLVDNSSGISGGAFQGSTVLHISGTTPFNRDTLIVNTLYFDHGQTFSLSHSLKTNYVVVDSSSTLVLNGHTLRTGGNSFTTQNGGKLSMANAVDTLNVAGGTAYFNGGASTLTAGDLEFQGLFQGYSAPGSPVATASANSFSPTAGLTAHLNSGCCGLMEFLNPGTGPTLSHFWMLQLSTSSTNTLYSNVFVDSLLLGEFSGANAKSDSSAQGVIRTITTKGVYNSGTFGLALQGVSIVLNDGVAASTFFNSVTWTNFPTISSGALFTQNRSSSPPSINFMTYSGVSFSGTGNFALNLGTSSLTLGLSITGGSGACVSAVLTTGNGCH